MDVKTEVLATLTELDTAVVVLGDVMGRCTAALARARRAALTAGQDVRHVNDTFNAFPQDLVRHMHARGLGDLVANVGRARTAALAGAGPADEAAFATRWTDTIHRLVP